MIVKAAALDVGPVCVNQLVVVLALLVRRRVTVVRPRFCSGELLYVEDRRDHQRIDYIPLGGKLVAQRSRPMNYNTATVTYHHTDHIGSANVETNAYGSQIERTFRMPYGSPYDGFYREGRGYAGHVTDTQTNLTYMQQRYYDPVALRFLSPDPVDVSASDGGNFNRYWYGNSNPYAFVDPDGRESIGSSERYHEDYRPPPSQSTPVVAGLSSVSSNSSPPQQQNNSGFNAKGLLVGKPSVEASGMAALGGGIQATKGLYTADGSVGIVTPALGLNASVNVNLITLSYTGIQPLRLPPK